MSSFISVPSISQSATRIADQIELHLESAHLESLEIQKHINRALARIRLQPMADIFVVQRQLAENLFLAGLQFGEELFELCFVEDITGSDRPGGAQLSFASRRNSSEDHFAEMILRAFLNTHRIGNSVRTIVKRRNWSDLGLQVAAMGVLFTNAVPTCFDLYAIGDTAALDPEQRAQREFRHERVSIPSHVLPAINVTRRNGNIDGNLRGKLLIRVARQPDLGRAKLDTQESLLEIDRPYRFGKKEIDGHSRIGLSENF